MIRGALAIIVFGTGGCLAAPPSGADECRGGQLLIEDVCRDLCNSNRDCDSSSVCRSGACIPGERGLVISSVDGDGPADGDSHLVYAGLIVTGDELDGAVVGLFSPTVAHADLPVRAGASATRLELDLPVDLVPGEYVLRVTNQNDETDEVSLTLLQGGQGADGPAGECASDVCVSPTLPGVGRVTSLVASASNGGAAPTLMMNGDAVPVSATADGAWLGVISRSTHTLSADAAHQRLYALSDPIDLDDLVTALSALATDDLVVFISRGDIAAQLLAPVQATTVADELMRFGASEVIKHLRGTEAVVLIGYDGIGEGNADLVLSSTGEAHATTVLAGASLLGARTTGLDTLGRSIESDEITDGTILAQDVATGEITGAHITDNSIEGVDIGDGQVTSSKIQDGSVSGNKIAVPITVGGLTVASNGNVGIGVASPNQNLHISGSLGFGGVDTGGAPRVSLIHVPSFNATCTVGGPVVRDWNATSCSGVGGCATGSCSTSAGWSTSAPSCTYNTDTGSGCSAATCYAAQWSQVICLGN